MTYTEFLQYIYQRYSGNIKLELDRMQGLLKDMRSPQDTLRGIHIGGTNGKGSTCATCEALALEHKLETGLNTSPHLIDYCERFRINGENTDFETILKLFHKYELLFTKWDASFFEITTAIAFQLFAERKVQFSIIEVGLGGRLDATNLFTPVVSAITTIGLDHVKTLGDTVEKIAYEKAGIIKKGIPTVLGKIESPALEVILNKADEVKADVYQFDKDYTVSKVRNTQAGICFNYRFQDYCYEDLRANLLGTHQAVNISTALTTFILYCLKQGIRPDETLIRSALTKINWMGRMQVLRQKPTVIVDGAHNLQGVEAFVSNLKEIFPGKKCLSVISILADKDYAHMLQAFSQIAKVFYISKNESDRAAEIEEQTDVVKSLECDYKTAITVKEAYKLALNDADENDIIIGAGSLYTVAEIIAAEQKTE
jgi:dihydrofolate synthase/folylpolyglutamate synthase